MQMRNRENLAADTNFVFLQKCLCHVALTFDIMTPTINAFLGPLVDHVFVKFDDPSCIGC